MSQSNLQAQIDAAKAYEEFFVPALCGQWAPRVATLAKLRPGDHVLDVACGTGVLTREVASRVEPGGFVAGVDANEGMLAVAAELAPSLEFRQASAETLPYDDQRFDAVVSQFGLMFFDRERALAEMLRVLKPNGRIAIAVWAALETAPAYAAEVELFERLGGSSAAEALRAPFVLGDPQELAQLLKTAGFKEVSVITEPGVARFPSIRFMVEADLRGWLPLMGVVLTEDQIQNILRESDAALSEYASADGSTNFVLPANICTAVKS